MDKNLAAVMELEIVARNTSRTPEMYWLDSDKLEGKAKILNLVSYTEESPWKIELKVKVKLFIPYLSGDMEALNEHPAKKNYNEEEKAFVMDMDVVAHLDIPNDLKNKLDEEGESNRSLQTMLEAPSEFHKLVVEKVTSVVNSAYNSWCGILNLG